MSRILRLSCSLLLLSSVVLLTACASPRSVPVEVQKVDTKIAMFHPPLPRPVQPVEGLKPLTCILDDPGQTIVYGFNESDDIRWGNYVANLIRQLDQLKEIVNYYRSLDNSSIVKKEIKE